LSQLSAAVGIAFAASLGALATGNDNDNYKVVKVLVAEDQWQGENRLIDPAPVFKPHETDAAAKYWISSNERGEEGEESKAGITIFEVGTNKVLAKLEIEDLCIPVIDLDGSVLKRFGGCAPPGAEGHPRHPHGIDIDEERKLAYQVIEHSGLKWKSDRSGFQKARTTDEESGLLVVYDVSNPRNPKILGGYVLGHAAEEVAVNGSNGKAYVGNHEPSPTDVPCFVSVIRHGSDHPYRFIDLPSDQDCVQGIEADEPLNTVNGTTHIGQKMFTFNSGNDTIAYHVDIRGPFNEFVAGLPGDQQFAIPEGWVLHMHDLTTDKVNHRAYQTIHTIADAATVEPPEEEEGTTPEADEITGRWVAEVNTDPKSKDFKKVRIIDLSNSQSVPEVRTHHDAVETGLPFNKLFVHAHFVAVDPERGALLVSGEHTGNLGVVDTRSRKLEQVVAISRPIPGCVIPPDPETGEVPEPEPHVHGVNVHRQSGTVYVSDEGEDCFYESVTILKPRD
jgi:hypothetical protein